MTKSLAGGLRVLHAIHDFLPRHRAGSEIYAAALCRELGKRHHVTLLSRPSTDLDRPHGDLRWRIEDGISVVEIVNNWRGTFADTYASPLINRRLEQLLDTVRPHILHVHSLLNLSLDLPALARRRGIEVVATLHDYTLVCASGGQRVHRAEQHVCRDIDPDRCARCFSESVFNTKLAVGAATGATVVGGLGRQAAAVLRSHAPRLAAASARVVTSVAPPIRTADITARLDAARVAMEQFSLVVSPSRSVAMEYQRLGLPADRLCVSDYGFVSLPDVPRARRSGTRLRAAYVGSLVWHKGVHVLLDAMQQVQDEAIELTVYGDPAVDPEYVMGLRRQAVGRQVRFAGAFGDDQRGEVLSATDVLVVPSLWLENSPLVIHEAFMARIPVIGTRMGGIEELIEDGVNGLLVEAGSPEALALALRHCADHGEVLARMSAGAPRVKSIEQDAQEWDARYRQVLEAATPRE